MTHIDLSDHQQARLQQLIREAEAVEARIAPLQDTAKALQMAIQNVMATILECNGAPDDQQFTLSKDLKRLVAAPKEG